MYCQREFRQNLPSDIVDSHHLICLRKNSATTSTVLVQMPKMLSSALALSADDDPVSFERA